jgi:hypothetical protein
MSADPNITCTSATSSCRCAELLGALRAARDRVSIRRECEGSDADRDGDLILRSLIGFLRSLMFNPRLPLESGVADRVKAPVRRRRRPSSSHETATDRWC